MKKITLVSLLILSIFLPSADALDLDVSKTLDSHIAVVVVKQITKNPQVFPIDQFPEVREYLDMGYKMEGSITEVDKEKFRIIFVITMTRYGPPN